MSAVAEIYADPSRFAAWLDKAAPGESFLYAIAGDLDREAAVVVAVAAARDAGAVVPVMGGREGERRYQVQRSGRARALSESMLPRISPVFAATPEGELFGLLCEIAEAGLPCPSNAELARRLGWEDRQQVMYRLRRLRGSGHVSVQLSDERVPWRTITIIETGARTALREEA